MAQVQEQQETVLSRQRTEAERAAWVETVQDMAGIDFSKWFTNDPGEINHTLHLLIKAIVVYPDRIVLEPRFVG